MDGTEVDLAQAMADRLAIQDAVTRIFVGADRRDWAAVHGVLAESVVLDYTSLFGGEPAAMAAGEVVNAWRDTLSGFDVTQHLLGSFLVDLISSEHANVTFYAIATHVLDAGAGDRTWTVAGHYEARLIKTDHWRVTALTLHLDWAAGNQNLATLARREAHQ